MDPATAMLINKLIDAGLAITSALRNVGVNYREVMDAQDAAAAEGRELNAEERDAFLSQAQSAIDNL